MSCYIALTLTLTLLITDGNLIIDFPGYTPERCNELKDIFNEEHPTKDFWAFCEVTNERRKDPAEEER